MAKVLSYEDVARDIISGRNIALVPQNAEYFIKQITEALHVSFNQGFHSAGGKTKEKPNE